MHHKKLRSLMFLVFGMCSIGFAEEFVIRRRQPKQSTSQLKETCCTTMGAALKDEIPELMRALADVQTLYVNLIEECAQGEKGTFFATASKHELEQCAMSVATLNEKIGALGFEMRQIQSRMNALTSTKK